MVSLCKLNFGKTHIGRFFSLLEPWMQPGVQALYLPLGDLAGTTVQAGQSFDPADLLLRPLAQDISPSPRTHRGVAVGLKAEQCLPSLVTDFFCCHCHI